MPEEQQLGLVKKRYEEAESYTSTWRKEARELYSMIAGDQWSEEDRLKMLESRRPAVTFNVSGKYIDAVSGLQITNRQEIKYLPREPGDSGVNEEMTGIADWVRDGADAEDEESEAFLDLITCGIGAMEQSISFDEDPEGNIAIERRDPMEMYWDPRARKRNVRDARWVMRVKYATEEDIIERWGEDVYQTLTGAMGIEPDISEYEIHHATEAWKYEHESFNLTDDRTIPVIEYQQWESINKVLVKTKFGTKEFSQPQWRKMKQVLDKNGVEYEVNRIKSRQYIRIFAAGNVILEAEESPYQEGFTFQILTGKRDRNRNEWYGIGRAIRDPQMWTNKLFSSILHAMAANSKGGLMAEEDAFEDPARAEEEWSNPDAITWLTPGALRDGKIEQKKPAEYPAGLDRLMQFALNSLPETSGLNMEIMGMANRVQPGVVEAQRKQSAMTVIAWSFDAMRRYYKDHGRQLAAYIRDFIADGRLARITTKQGQQYIPIMKDKMTLKFDVVVDEAPTSANVKERVWMMLEGLLPHLLKMGMPIPPEVLDYSPLPVDLQTAWKEAMNKPPSPEQKQQMELDLKDQQAEIGKDESITELNVAKAAHERAKTGVTAAGA